MLKKLFCCIENGQTDNNGRQANVIINANNL